jgi:hypothetical protein
LNDTAKLVITVTDPPPNFSLGADTTICNSEVLKLCAPTGNYLYSWSNGRSDSCIVVDTEACYNLRLAYPNGCASFDTLCLSIDLCLSVEEQTQPIASIYPNPANNALTITFNNNQSTQIEVYDVGGIS